MAHWSGPCSASFRLPGARGERRAGPAARLPPGSDPAAVVAGARRQDMWLCSVDDLRFQPEPGAPGLILGYGNLNDSLVDEAVAVLAGLLSPADNAEAGGVVPGSRS